MGRQIRHEQHLLLDELERRYGVAQEPHERRYWQTLWPAGPGQHRQVRSCGS